MFNRSGKYDGDEYDYESFDKDNKLYTEILMPPEGYKLEKAVCTTYTLDFNAYLAVLMAFSGDNMEYNGNCPFEEQIVAVKEISEKVTVFYDVGHARNKIPAVDALLKNIKPISLRKMDNDKRIPAFHPKVWLLKYTKGNNAKFKFVVLSRNLSFDTSWDTFIVFNGKEKVDKNTVAAENTMAILKLLEHLKIDEDWRKDLVCIGFSLKGNENAEIIPLIASENDKFTFKDDYKKAVIMSPFVNNGFFKDILKGKFSEKPITLITRETANLNIDDKFDVFTLNQKLEAQKTDSDNQNKSEYISETGIHAKIYLFEKEGGKSDLYIGSANATTAAFSKNTELLVKIPDVEYTCDDFLNEVHLNDWFSHYTGTNEEESVSDESDDFLREICAMEWKGELCEEKENCEEKKNIVLTINIPKDCPKDGSIIINGEPISNEQMEFRYENARDISKWFTVKVNDKEGLLQIEITNEDVFQKKIEQSVFEKFNKDAFLQRYFADSKNRKRLLKKKEGKNVSQNRKAYSANGHTNFSYEDMLLCAVEKEEKFRALAENDIFKNDDLIGRIQKCLKGEKK